MILCRVTEQVFISEGREVYVGRDGRLCRVHSFTVKW